MDKKKLDISSTDDLAKLLSVIHLDASKSVVSWAQRNIAASKISHYPVRYIIDDCMTFIDKEIRRGRKYDGLIFDPPAFGR